MEVLGRIFVPSGIAYVSFTLGLLAFVFASTRRWSIVFVAVAAAITLVFSSGMTAAALMSPLEHSHPSIHSARSHPEARSIVVLTGWASEDEDLPLSGRMNASSAYRVLLALDLYRDCDHCIVIVSGDQVTADIMSRTLQDLGVERSRLRTDGASMSTAQSALHIRPLVGSDSFFLVTSAGHLPRSLDAMRAADLHPIAAPTDHQLPRNWRKAELFPRPESLVVSDLAIREYLGRAYYALLDIFTE